MWEVWKTLVNNYVTIFGTMINPPQASQVTKKFINIDSSAQQTFPDRC